MLVSATSVHTEKGSHSTQMQAWSRWAPAEVKREAAKLPFEHALEAITSGCGGRCSL